MYLKLNSDGLTNRVVRNDDTNYTDTVYIHVQFRNSAMVNRFKPLLLLIVQLVNIL